MTHKLTPAEWVILKVWMQNVSLAYTNGQHPNWLTPYSKTADECGISLQRLDYVIHLSEPWQRDIAAKMGES